MKHSLDCKNPKCRAIYHVEVKTFKPHKLKASCPFCGLKTKIKVGEDDE
ncbi:MAG: hypothetical protein RBT59_10450 [Arcobacteraceae bacterium]|jgi:hypothetical protein|nr:hypothetical protein [Arcobacteraceae bacterium]